MGKVKRNTASNRYREGVGAASLYDPKRDKWRMNCTRQGIPNQLQRCIVDGIKGVEAHFDILEKFLKDHGQSGAKLLNNFDFEDLAIANRSIGIFNKETDKKFQLSELIELGISSARQSLLENKSPLLSEIIDDYLEYRATPQGNSRGNWVIDDNTRTSERSTFKTIKKKFGSFSMKSLFCPKWGFRERVKKFASKEWHNLAPKTLSDRAKMLRMALDYYLSSNPCLSQENPLKDIERSFNKPNKISGIHPTLKPNQIEELFKNAVNNAKWRHLIPYMALLFFSGSRPYDVASQKKASRRWQWEWFDSWHNPSSVSGGYLATLPAWREDGLKGSSKKTQVAQERDLTQNGFDWIEWYFHSIGKAVPTSGKVYFSRVYWDQLRAYSIGLGKNWQPDITRKSFASYAHNFWPDKSEYWCDHLDHKLETYKRFYKGKTTRAEAEEFFNISPLNLIDSDSNDYQIKLNAA